AVAVSVRADAAAARDRSAVDSSLCLSPHLAVFFFARLAPSLGALDIQRQALRHFLKPRRQILHAVAGPGLNGELQKDRLRGVFGIVRIAQNAQTSAEDHARITAHDFLERRLASV